MRSMVLAVSLVCSWGVLSSCQVDEEFARRAWLQNTLIEDNRDFLDRDPLATAAKWEKMASDLYFYFRGTSSVFVADLQNPAHGGGWATEFGTAAAAQVATLADPHPENLGTFRWADGTMSVEYNDFDGALYGPYYFGVRRLATGFGVLARRSAELDSDDEAGLAEAVAQGYVDEILALSANEAPTVLRAGQDNGVIIDDLLRRARRDGDAHQNFTRYTRVVDGRRQMILGDLEPPRGAVLTRRMEPLSDEEKRLLTSLLEEYPDTLVDAESLGAQRLYFLDGARRFGAGVSSYPGLRYYLLVADDPDAVNAPVEELLLLEFKELRDPTGVGGLELWPPRPFKHNAERLVTLRRAFHEVPDTDPWLGWAAEGSVGFRVRHLTRYQRNISVDRITEKIADRDWEAADLTRLAYEAGRILARGHARSPTSSGEAGLDAIHAAVHDDPESFVEETRAFTVEYIDRYVADYGLFIELLEQHGPLLGYRPRSHRSLR